MRGRFAGSFAVALVGLGMPAARQVGAQVTCTTNPCTITDNVSLTISSTIQLTLSENATVLTSPLTANFGTVASPGTTGTTGPNISVQANIPWSLNVKANAATFTPSGGSTYNKPASDVSVTLDGTTKTLSTTNQALETAQAATSSYTQTASYTTAFVWTLDTPGNYALGVAYTISAP